MKRSWITDPPRKPATFVDPMGELPEFLARRLINARKKQSTSRFLYTHPYVSFLESMVFWARSEHNAEFFYFAECNNMNMVERLRQYGPQYVLANHPDFPEMIGIITQETWDMCSRRMKDHLIAAYEVAQEMGIVRRSIELEIAFGMVQQALPNPVSKKDVISGLIEFFEGRR